jgi:hypothetical protein
MELDGAMVESVASFTDGIRVPLMFMPYDKSKIIQNFQLLWGMVRFSSFWVGWPYWTPTVDFPLEL